MNISDGTSQNYRSQHLTGDSFIHVDEYSFHDLVCYVKEFAKNIKYYNLDNEHDGHWDELLITDEIISISEIIILNIKPLEDTFNNNYNNNIEGPSQYIEKQIRIVQELARHINKWYKQLVTNEMFNSKGMVKEIDFLIRDKLAEGFQFCLDLQKGASSPDRPEEESSQLKEFDKIWWSKKNSFIFEDPIKINKNLKKVFYNFNNSIYYLKKTAYKHFNTSLKSQQHSPYLSILFTFIELYLNARSELNTFPKKYHQFYYNNILKVSPKAYRPDSTFLLFTLKDGVENVFIPKGTKFIGGKDEENKKIIYAADNDVVINKAKIGRILTLYLEQNELINPKCDSTNILKNEIPVQETESYIPKKSNKWPLFGSPMKQNGEYAELGFAISDKNLLAKEGAREVKSTFTFTAKSFQQFHNQLEAIKGEYLITEMFVKLLSNMFNIYLTTCEGWRKIDNYIVNCSIIDSALEPYTLDVGFKMPHDAPAIAAYQQEIHGQEFHEGVPLLKFLLNNESYLFPYSLLQKLELEKITTTVKVRDLKDILVVNEFGRIDISNPFYPFGPIPRVNSYFIFGNHEISQKNLTNLHLFIKWNNLPKGENGLQDYFKEYDVNISKNDYKCHITFLNNGNWLPEEETLQESVQLLTAGENEKYKDTEKLNSYSNFLDIDTSYYKIDDRKTEAENYSYNNYAVGGFIKFSLTNPNFQFGHNAYPSKLAKLSLLNAKNKKQLPLPNQPLSPMADFMSLGYSSQSSINFALKHSAEKNSTARFYHLHPWGYENMMESTQLKTSKLLPEYNAQGNLLLALEHSKPNMTVSVFFKLLDDTTPEVEEKPPKITWQYLSGNFWKPLSKANLVSDSTNQLLQSGIVTICLPADINKQNTILSNQYHWIRISAQEHLENVSSVAFISTQAIQATWENQGNTLTHLQTPLPAMTIAKPQKNLHGIKIIVQPANSFNGKPPENLKQTKIRVSERLKHKNRAVTPWDYELLILEKFPEILKVKCIPHMSSQKKVHPGHAMITVIRKIEKENPHMDIDPCVNNITLLKIKHFVKEIASGFADIEVRNPVFERVIVRCSIKIKAGLDAGYFINQLNKELIRFLSPWQTGEGEEPSFGKTIKCTDVLSFVQSLNFIEFATDFSMLQITHDEKTKHSLLDTAERTHKEKQEGTPFIFETTKGQKELKPTLPWGIMVSAEKHDIVLIDQHQEIEPVKTGIDELEVGETFVITSKKITNGNQ